MEVPEKVKVNLALSVDEAPISMYRCMPVFLPQIVGVVIPEVPVTTNESVHSPPLVSVVAEGPAMVMVSKSRRMAQTASEHFSIGNE